MTVEPALPVPAATLERQGDAESREWDYPPVAAARAALIAAVGVEPIDDADLIEADMVTRAVLAAAVPHLERRIRESIAGEIEPILLALSDTLDPEEGPVILAWAAPNLAAAIADRLRAAS